MVVGDVAGESDFDFVCGAVAVEFAARKVGVALLDAVVDCGVDTRHIDLSTVKEEKLSRSLSFGMFSGFRSGRLQVLSSAKVPLTGLYIGAHVSKPQTTHPSSDYQTVFEAIRHIDGAISCFLTALWIFVCGTA